MRFTQRRHEIMEYAEICIVKLLIVLLIKYTNTQTNSNTALHTKNAYKI